jgi:hypothetical protein
MGFFALFPPEQRFCAPPRTIDLRDKRQSEKQGLIDGGRTMTWTILAVASRTSGGKQ